MQYLDGLTLPPNLQIRRISSFPRGFCIYFAFQDAWSGVHSDVTERQNAHGLQLARPEHPMLTKE